jgi:hypothetical protein
MLRQRVVSNYAAGSLTSELLSLQGEHSYSEHDAENIRQS